MIHITQIPIHTETYRGIGYPDTHSKCSITESNTQHFAQTGRLATTAFPFQGHHPILFLSFIPKPFDKHDTYTSHTAQDIEEHSSQKHIQEMLDHNSLKHERLERQCLSAA